MKQIEVSIMGQSYLLGCPEGGEVQLRQAVSHVDREMCAIRDSGKLKARERIAVLSALNLAYELAGMAERLKQLPTAAPPPASALRSEGDGALSQAYLDSLIQRLDTALGDDGHLL